MLDQMKMMWTLMQDENFRAFISHPKVRELFGDPEFRKIVESKDVAKMTAHPKFAALMRDPEFAGLATKLDWKKLMPGGAGG